MVSAFPSGLTFGVATASRGHDHFLFHLAFAILTHLSFCRALALCGCIDIARLILLLFTMVFA